MTRYILGYGNPVYDLISTPALRRTDRVLSGCSTNACLAVSKLGLNTGLVGCVGEDFEQRFKDDLAKYGIESELGVSEETGGFSLIYDERGDRDLDVLGVAGMVPITDFALDKADFVLFGPILGEVSNELARFVKENTNAPILLDPQGTLRGIKDGSIIHEMTENFREVAKLSTVVKANELETELITGINARLEPEKAVKALYETGCEIAVSTLAEAGSMIYDGKDVYVIPPYTTDAVDPTGAGDTYAAGFMAKYLETPDDLTAVGCYGSAVSSVMVENSGPDFPLTREEADRRFNQLMQGEKTLKLKFTTRDN